MVPQSQLPLPQTCLLNLNSFFMVRSRGRLNNKSESQGHRKLGRLLQKFPFTTKLQHLRWKVVLTDSPFPILSLYPSLISCHNQRSPVHRTVIPLAYLLFHFSPQPLVILLANLSLILTLNSPFCYTGCFTSTDTSNNVITCKSLVFIT